MEDFFRKTVMAGLGFLDMTKEKVEEFIDDMIKRGELTQDERSRYVKETMEKVEQRTSEAKIWVQQQVQETIAQIKPKAQKAVDELEIKLNELTAEVQKLKEQLNKK